MTRLFFFALLFLQVYTLQAQLGAYVPFPTDTARWGMFQQQTVYTSGGQISIQYTNHYDEELRGDTTINGMTYSKVYSNNILLGGVREDANQRVWFYGFPNATGAYSNGFWGAPLPPYTPGQELLLYDFSLGLGEVVYMYAQFQYAPTTLVQDSIKCQVVRIDSVLLIDGSYRKMLEIEASVFPDTNGFVALSTILYWVEGIGGIGFTNRQYIEGNATLGSDPKEESGLFSSVHLEYFNVSSQFETHLVSCFFDHNTQYIGYNRGPLCSNQIGVDQVPSTLASVQVAPNPFQQQTTFTVETLPTYKRYTLQVYTTTGQLVAQVQTATPSITLERQQLNTGLYFYKILGDTTWLHSGKVVVE